MNQYMVLMHEKQGRYSDAEPLFKRTVEIYEKALGSDHPNVATALNNLGGLLSTQVPLSTRILLNSVH